MSVNLSVTSASTPSVPLWQQLQLTAQVLQAVRGGASATRALTNVPAALRPGVQSLLFHVLRVLGQAEALRRKLAPRNPPPPVDALLCTALALALDAEQAPYEPFTLVDQTVEAAKRQSATRGQASFVNACLRRFLREENELMQSVAQEPVARWNHPRWWIDRLRKDHPQHWQGILQTNAGRASMTLRVNTGQHGWRDYQDLLVSAGKSSVRVGEQALMLRQPCHVDALPGFSSGAVSVQDAGAQLAAPLLLQGLSAPTGERLKLLDACAAPGGKTAHLLELLQASGTAADVVAMDIDAERCTRIDDTLRRLNLNSSTVTAQVLVADAQAPAQWWGPKTPKTLYDGILLDAPCTASGIVRRHPDVRWLRRESDVNQLAVIQAGLLSVLWPLVKPGGQLLYCTCSVFKAEGQDQVAAFLRHHPEARLAESPGHLLPVAAWNPLKSTDNSSQDEAIDHDGFFYALLQKSRQS
jgi:16S rRNA (cytosine967-C5)-methyltransferase